MNNSEKHVITYPGFAEGYTARGLYPEIKNAFAHYTFHMLPFYEEMPNGERVVHSIDEHKDILQKYMDRLDGEIIMLGKCGGSRVVTAMDEEHISRVAKMTLFNPPWAINKEGLEKRFLGWQGNERADGSWAIPRNDSPPYVVTAEYMRRVTGTSFIDNYKRIAQSPSTTLFIVRGMEDKVVPPIRIDKIPGAVPIDIENGDHHLMGESRIKVIGALATYNVLRNAEIFAE